MYDLPAGCLASRLSHIPFVAYMFDDYAYQWTGAFRSLSILMERKVVKRAKGMIVPNEYLHEAYNRRYGVIGTLIRNPSPLYDLDELDKAERVLEKEAANIVYAGAVYHANDDALRNLVEAMSRIGRRDVRFHIYTSQAEQEIKERGVAGPGVIYHAHISESEITKVLRQADILFLPLAFSSPIQEVIRTSAPGKMGEYLSVAKPILVHAPRDSFCSWFFQSHECGVVVTNSDSGLLAKQIENIMTNREVQKTLSEKARRVSEKFFRIEESQKTFIDVIRSLAGGRGLVLS
jgi:glycosyltransferase involved in cell wall biosynthesis